MFPSSTQITLPSGTTFDSSGSFSTTIKVPSTLGAGFYPIKVSDGSKSEVRMFNVVGASQKFQLTASPQFLPPVLQGDTSNAIVATVTSVSGQDSPPVTVKVEGLPPGMSLTSRILRQEFPELTTRLPTLWTRSYFVSTHGHVSMDVIKKYIEEQKGAVR